MISQCFVMGAECFLCHCKKLSKNLSGLLAAKLKSTALSQCVTKLHSTDRLCNRIFSGMLTKSFTSITGIIQGHLLIFSLHEEPQSY